MMLRVSVLITILLLLSSPLGVIQASPTFNLTNLYDSSANTLQQQFTLTALTSNTTFKTPEWVKHAIFYQIFPDRFRDGDSSNNAIGTGISGDALWKSWPRGSAVYAVNTPWNQLPEEPAQGKDWFGGDLKGVQDEAQYLADLGITAIYFNPIMDSTDNHGYTVIDYKSVNRYFGTHKRAANGTLILDPNSSLQVFKNMTKELDNYGIKIILDGVFNHVSAKNHWFDRDNDFPSLGAYESNISQWYTWFTFYDWPNSYKGWSGFLNLPEVNETDDFKNYIFRDQNGSVIKFWNDLGVDGWRLDTGQDVSHTFWKEFRTAYKQLNPDGYIVGEYFGDASPWLQGDEWDSVMNYRFRDAVLTWASGEEVLSVTGFNNRLTSIQSNYPSEAFYTAFNLLGSHDTERALTYLVGDKNKMKLAVIFQMTYPGTPVIYYGDEVGMQGLTDPDCRRPYLWQDLGFSPDLDMMTHYKKLISIRKSYSVLRRGSLSTLSVDDSNHIYALVRQDSSLNPIAVLVYNNGNMSKTATLNLTGFLQDGSGLTDVLNYKSYKVEGGKVTLQVDALWAGILIGGPVSLPVQPTSFPFVYIVIIGVVAIAITVTYIVLRRRKLIQKP
jgi:alpha-glucosidase